MSRNNEQSTFLQKHLEDGPVTILHMKNKQFILEVVNDCKTKSRANIKAGNIKAILKNMKHEPAEATELESAIADIEDQLMPIINNLPKRRCLITSDHVFWKIAKVAGFNTDDNLQLDINIVEEIFNRLANVAYGIPASRLGVPENREFAATVLFLRELMHHASFNFIILRH